MAGVTVKSVQVNIGPGGPNLLAFLAPEESLGTRLILGLPDHKFGPPPDPFFLADLVPSRRIRTPCRVYNLQIEGIKKRTSTLRGLCRRFIQNVRIRHNA